ncbi:MAG: peptidase M48 family protein [Micavibrio aeruginosavorus]|uniref:Peptidase M48 family protein n=1 Tax=Micavibrio aeruginosavorus TaxID=349221 RepID=A0A2W5Q2X1_9BACT|nr:MAG: peptidase M48 family protein [Micavibrio aeruginosavorus]
MNEQTAPVTGLQTSIWNNNIKSLVVLALYPFILGAVLFAAVMVYGFLSGHALGYADDHVQSTWQSAVQYASFVTQQYWPTVLTIVAVWFVIAYFFQGMMIRAMAKSHSINRKDEPELYNLVENLCIASGTSMPRIEIVETHARNAFASGINEDSYCITVTRGLLQSLAKDELEGVLAHELTHILNRDVRLMMVCVVFTGMFGISAQLVWSNIRYGLYFPRSGDGRQRGGGMMLLFSLAALLWLGYMATLLARFAISRNREYMADAGAIKITKNPEAMMRALIRISGTSEIPMAPDDIRAMCFENPRAFMGLFATHPPIQSRLKAIADYSGLPVPDLRPKLRAEENDAFGRPAPPRDNWATRTRYKSRRTGNPWA